MPSSSSGGHTEGYDHPAAVLSLETPVNGGPIYFSTTMNIFRPNP